MRNLMRLTRKQIQPRNRSNKREAEQEVKSALSSVEVLVLGEQVVEDTQGRLEVQVDDVFGPGLWLRQARVLHQLKGQGHIRHLLGKGLKKNKPNFFENEAKDYQSTFRKQYFDRPKALN
jgi:hypothetical protein